MEKHDLFKPTTQSLEPCICVLKKNLIGVFKDEFLVVADVGKYQHRNDQPPKRGTIEDVEVAADLEKLLKPLQFSSTVLGFGMF